MSRSLVVGGGALGLLLFSLASCTAILGLDDLQARPKPADAAPIDAPADAGDAGQCTSNAACMDQANGAPAVCIDGACVRVDRDEQGKEVCGEVYPSKEILRQEGVILFARVASGPNEAHRLVEKWAIEDFDHNGGIGSIEKPRPIALAVCTSSAPDRVDAVVDHVTKRLRVPGMLLEIAATTTGDDQVMRAQVEKAVKANVFVLNPSKATPSLKYADTGQLLLNLLGPDEDVATAYRPLLARVEKAVRVQRRRAGGAENDPVRVAVVRPTVPAGALEVFRLGAEGEGATRDAARALTFNDGGVKENEDAGTYAPFDMVGGTLGNAQYYKDRADALRLLKPDVVIMMTYEDATGELIGQYEARNVGDTAGPAPFWLLGPTNANLTVELKSGLATAPPGKTLINRLWGIQVAGPIDRTEGDAWRARMANEHPESVAGTEAAENFYDAVYWLVYGLAAAGPPATGGKFTGSDIARGVRALWGPGEAADAVTTGRDAIPRALERIKLGKRAPVFIGALGMPDIDTRFSTWNSVGGVYCYGFDAKRAIKIAYDIARYDIAKNDLVADATRGGFATGLCGDGQAFLADYNIK